MRPLLYAILTLFAGQTVHAQAKFDGPAELPRVYVKSAIADTPAPGKIIAVKAGENLQDALNHAACGDTLTLETGATFTGHFVLPKKACDDAHWIIIRTSSPDEALPRRRNTAYPMLCRSGFASRPPRFSLRFLHECDGQDRLCGPRRLGANRF